MTPGAAEGPRVRQWLKANLFRNRADSVVTVVAGVLVAYVAFRIGRFVLVTGRWEVIRSNLTLFVVGRYDRDQMWRPAASLIVAGGFAGLLAGAIRRRQVIAERAPSTEGSPGAELTAILGRSWPAVVGVLLLLTLASTGTPSVVVAATLAAAVAGRWAGRRMPRATLPALAVSAPVVLWAMVWFLAGPVGWDGWGGLMLNVFLAATSITLCFPLGVLLALGRRSELPLIRAVSTGYIELFRGVPLIALLIMANVALGFFIPSSLAPGKVVRAIVIFTLFTAAYVAEIVRGGLQSVPNGQLEAGRALGLSPVLVTFGVQLPQALRNVIPALVGQFISLFKDTTLAGAAMGFVDLLAATESATAQPAFRGQGLVAETIVFVAFLFWVGAYTMSRESQRLERRLGVGER